MLWGCTSGSGIPEGGARPWEPVAAKPALAVDGRSVTTRVGHRLRQAAFGDTRPQLKHRSLCFTMDIVALNRRTLATLESWRGKSKFIESDGGYWEVSFPVSAGAEYSFSACIYTDGEVQIHAQRVDSTDQEYFGTNHMKNRIILL